MSTCGIHNHVPINSNESKLPRAVTAIQSLPSKDKAFPFLKAWVLSNVSLLFTTHGSPESIHFIIVGAHPSSQAHLKFLNFLQSSPDAPKELRQSKPPDGTLFLDSLHSASFKCLSFLLLDATSPEAIISVSLLFIIYLYPSNTKEKHIYQSVPVSSDPCIHIVPKVLEVNIFSVIIYFRQWMCLLNDIHGVLNI